MGKTFKIELDKERTLVYTFNSIVKLEELGIPLQTIEDPKKMMSNIRALLWVGLIHEDPSLTIEDVGNLIGFDKLNYVIAKITEVFVGLGVAE